MKLFNALPITMLLSMNAGISASIFCEKYNARCGNISSWSGCATDFANTNVGKGDKNADTQACRNYHLGLAEVSPAAATAHCPHASKMGGTVCVDNTANFCTRYTATCNSISAWSDCATDFAAFSEGAGTTGANTQACRLYHLSLAEASASAANAHCPHASKAGTGVCEAAPALDASNFCARFGSTCTFTNNNWADCATAFAKVNVGKGDKNANTQACRLYHLGLAEQKKADAVNHCPHAGSTGSPVCVDNAANFCARYTATCNTISAWADCATDFAAFSVGKGDKSTDTQACRLYHLSLAEASASAATTHCPHASKTGGNVCVDNAANFCTRYTATCNTISAWADCATDFPKVNVGKGDKSADTQACRLHHLSLAEDSASAATTHCPHASKAGGGVCVDNTGNFCTRYQATCGSISAWTACTTDFSLLGAGAGNVNADTQACRLYHLSLAEASTSAATAHCPHASKDGGGVCAAEKKELNQGVAYASHISLIVTAILMVI